MENIDWMMKAACRKVDPDIFFPNDGMGVQTAQKICAGCEVAGICLDYALSNHINHGVYGGASERERRRIRQQRSADNREQLGS
jgi:WhiB family redox-sensing transcriptional regulator